jgi:hypothetical protein
LIDLAPVTVLIIVATGCSVTGIATGAATGGPPLDGSFIICRLGTFTHSTRSLAPPANCKQLRLLLYLSQMQMLDIKTQNQMDQLVRKDLKNYSNLDLVSSQ